MAPKFGTSGLRGLVVELTPSLVADHIRAFIAACPMVTGLFVGRDLRDSSPMLADVVIAAARGEGVDVTDCGAVPTPALALAAMGAGAAAVMVTGSHIPADRNGLKFYLPGGEITKSDEAAILGALGRVAGAGQGDLGWNQTAGADWVARYVAGFGAGALAGLRIGVWSHSAVSRDLLADALRGLGAEVVEVGRSDTFIPVDTEAVPDWARSQISGWVAAHRLDALVSTDGDGDRPLVADATGAVVPGDILGQITARVVGAEVVVTPVSSNTGVEASGHFAHVIRTKIGSPFVIAGMAVGGRVVGYEANGGFLLGFPATLAGPLAALATRDSLLPILAPLVAGREVGLAALVAAEPLRFTAADRIEDIPTDRSAALLARWIADPAALAGLLAEVGEVPLSTDLTDGLRVTCASGRVLHLRPSGNAPEFRVYVEAEARDIAADLLARALTVVGAACRAGE
jgi:phosphomannomutase